MITGLAALAAIVAPFVVWMTIGRTLVAVGSGTPTGGPSAGGTVATPEEVTTAADLRIGTVVDFGDELLIGLAPEPGSGLRAETLRMPSGAAARAVVQRWRIDGTGLRAHRRSGHVMLLDPVDEATVTCEPPVVPG